MKKVFCCASIVVLLSICVKVVAQNKAGRTQVGQRTFLFEDTSRSRKLVTEVWYPTTETAKEENQIPFIRMATARDAAISKGRFPLILFSHGTGGGRLTVEWFCAGLAANGFIVAAVDHFGNTFDNPIPIEFAKFWERPQDIRFILDRLLESDVASSVNINSIGMAGFSLGGYTSIAVAGAQMDYEALVAYTKTERGKKEADIPEMPGLISMLDQAEMHALFKKAPPLHDARIKSVFVMSPALGQGFPSKENFKNVSVPVYIVVAGNDQICPMETNAKHYAAQIRSAQCKVVGEKAGHYVFLNEAKEGLKSEAPVFFQDAAGVDRHAVHEQTLSQAVDHFRKTLK
ncbi:MAG TPA: alpha/beta fold hydrolase [Chryseolinea sp.]|nr:alpha/beta fold hydrolase [Chryseolinea sp.]